MIGKFKKCANSRLGFWRFDFEPNVTIKNEFVKVFLYLYKIILQFHQSFPAALNFDISVIINVLSVNQSGSLVLPPEQVFYEIAAGFMGRLNPLPQKHCNFSCFSASHFLLFCYYTISSEMQRKNLYAILGLVWGASDRQVKEAYRRLAKEHHPDLHPTDIQADDRFKEIVGAYWILSDPKRKSEYLLQAGTGFSAPAGAAENSTSNHAPQDGPDIIVHLYLTLEEIAAGITKKVKIRQRCLCPSCSGQGQCGMAAKNDCPACHGTGRVPDLLQLRKGVPRSYLTCRKCGGSGHALPVICPVCSGKGLHLAETSISVGVPAGVEDRAKIVVKGQGHYGLLGGQAGDLKVIIQQKPHPYLIRRGSDLIYRRALTLLQWLQGAKLQVPGLEGSLSLQLAPGQKSAGMLKIRGHGLPRSDGTRGDLLVQYHVCLPQNLSKKQITLLDRLQATPGFSPLLDERGWQTQPLPADGDK